MSHAYKFGMNKRETLVAGFLCSISCQALSTPSLCTSGRTSLTSVPPSPHCQFLSMAQRALHSTVSVSPDLGWLHLCGGPRWEDHVHLGDSLSPPGSFSGR